ncbi:unnamed protein product [Rotaria magnacalcarata]|nr:unnamed protein product [Rotaria magnacalcarata]CAF4994129.1 unnamed protein product [Rotaria magnacalcarata]
MHESVSSSECVKTEPCSKRSNHYQRSQSPNINNSLATDSCSQSPLSSYENLVPTKNISSSSYMHPMNVYHHSAGFQQHYSGLNF